MKIYQNSVCIKLKTSNTEEEIKDIIDELLHTSCENILFEEIFFEHDKYKYISFDSIQFKNCRLICLDHATYVDLSSIWEFLKQDKYEQFEQLLNNNDIIDKLNKVIIEHNQTIYGIKISPVTPKIASVENLLVSILTSFLEIALYNQKLLYSLVIDTKISSDTKHIPWSVYIDSRKFTTHFVLKEVFGFSTDNVDNCRLPPMKTIIVNDETYLLTTSIVNILTKLMIKLLTVKNSDHKKQLHYNTIQQILSHVSIIK